MLFRSIDCIVDSVIVSITVTHSSLCCWPSSRWSTSMSRRRCARQPASDEDSGHSTAGTLSCRTTNGVNETTLTHIRLFRSVRSSCSRPPCLVKCPNAFVLVIHCKSSPAAAAFIAGDSDQSPVRNSPLSDRCRCSMHGLVTTHDEIGLPWPSQVLVVTYGHQRVL